MLASQVLAKAEKAGITLVENSNLVEARRGKLVVAFHSDPNKALAKALEREEADRIRKLVSAVGEEMVIPAKGKIIKAPLIAEAMPLTIEEKIDDAIKQTVIKGSIIKARYKDRYKADGSCGDEIAGELREYIVVLVKGKGRVSVERLKEVAVTNGVWVESYGSLNVGQQRMNIGNKLRAKFKNGEEINIGGAIFVKEFKDL